jgi:hypothetical protein
VDTFTTRRYSSSISWVCSIADCMPPETPISPTHHNTELWQGHIQVPPLLLRRQQRRQEQRRRCRALAKPKQTIRSMLPQCVTE